MSETGYGWTDEVPHSCEYLTDNLLAVARRERPGTVLDLGCGNGSLIHAFRKEGFAADGIELDEDGARLASERNPDAAIYQGSLSDAAFVERVKRDSRAPYQLIVSSEVIEHMFEPRDLLRAAAQLMSRDGRLVITTPYHGYLKNLAISITGKWDTHADPFWTGGHIKFFSRKTLTKMLLECGFDLQAFSGVGRAPYLWKSMILVASRRN